MTNAEDRNVDATRTRMADPLVMGALPRTKVWIHPTHPLSVCVLPGPSHGSALQKQGGVHSHTVRTER